MSVDKKKALTLFALTLLIVSLLLVNMNEPLGAPAKALSIPPTLYVDPPSATRVAGSTFEINVSVRDVTVDMRLVAVQFRLTYSPDLLEVRSVTEGQFLRDPRWNRYGTWFYSSVEPDGVYGPHILVAQLLLPNATGGWEVFPYGGGNIATITFRCKGPGGCALSLLETMLFNDTMEEIPHLTEDGQVYQLPLTMDLELYPRVVKDLGNPTGYQWHELHPNKTNFYNLTSWEPGNVLSPEDVVWMDGLTFEVDDVTIDIVVHD